MAVRQFRAPMSLCLLPLFDGCRAEMPSQRRSGWIWRKTRAKTAPKKPENSPVLEMVLLTVGSDIEYIAVFQVPLLSLRRRDVSVFSDQ